MAQIACHFQGTVRKGHVYSIYLVRPEENEGLVYTCEPGLII